MRKFGFVCFVAVVLVAAIACTRKTAAQQLVVEIPAGFNGNFVLDMGVRGAVSLPRKGDAYVLDLPMNGKVQTSTLLENPQVTFKSSSDGKSMGILSTDLHHRRRHLGRWKNRILRGNSEAI